MPVWTPAEMLTMLAAVRVDYSVSSSDLEDWLGEPEYTPYPAIAEALLSLLGDRGLAQPVFLDVIVFNYEEHAASPRTAAEVVVDTLKSAILEGSNDRYGGLGTSFETLLVPLSPIEIKWEELGGAAGILGAPVGPETGTSDGAGRKRDFAGGTIAWHPAVGAHFVGGAIGSRWRELGREQWGFPTTDETAASDGSGRFNHFRIATAPGTADCSIYWHPATGAHEVVGAIRSRWSDLGGESGDLGYPIGPELPRAGGGRIQEFQKNSLGWTAESGVFFGRVTLAQRIVTPSVAALGGEAAFDLMHDGTYRFRGHMHDSGATDYNFRVRATVGSGGGLVLTAQKGGEVEGTESWGPERTLEWNETGTSALLQLEFPFLRPETFTLTKEYSTAGIIGGAGSVLLDLASLIITGVIAGPYVAGAMLVAKELTAAAGTSVIGLSGLTGTVVTAAASLLVGPTFALPIFVGTAIATNVLFIQRTISPEEYAFADLVFRGTLPPREKITLTNLSGLNQRPFTVPNVDDGVLVNMGDALTSAPGGPMHAVSGNYPLPGQLLIHELTHAWQWARRSFVPGYVCRGALSHNYQPPAAGTPWGEFGLEEQASTVDQWFRRCLQDPATMKPKAPMADPRGYLEDQGALRDEYFPYIDGKIRLALTS